MEQNKSSKGYLKSAFSYESTILPESVQALFTSMVDKPDVNVEYVDEIIKAGMSGRIRLNSDFNLEGYCYKIQQTQDKLVKPKKQQKETYLEFDDSDFEGTAQKGGVRVGTIKKLEDSFEEIENDSELLFAIETIEKIQLDFLVEEGINLKMLISRAIGGVPQAIEGLIRVCEDFELVGEQIKIILSSGKDVSSLCLC